MFAKHMHHLGEQGLGGDVISRYHTSFQQIETDGILPHRNRSGVALRLIDNHDASLHSCVQALVEPIVGRGVARTKSLQYHATEIRHIQYRSYYLLCDAREELEDSHTGVKALKDMQRTSHITHRLYELAMICDMHARFSKSWVVIGVKSREMLCITLGSAIAAI